MHESLQLLMLFLAAFGGGLLNAAAGGGTFLTLPALMLAGVPAVSANATGTVALLPGYIASTLGFREELGAGRSTSHIWHILIACILGGMIGAWLLLVTSNHTFRQIVPWFMLVATLWFALWPIVEKHFHQDRKAGAAATFIGILGVSIYGGYFNGGLGIILLALLGSLGFKDLNFMNGLKNAVSAILTTIAVLIYGLGGTVVWNYAFLMIAGAVTGGYVGARWARRLPKAWLRAGIVAVGTFMTIMFFRWQ